MVIVLQPPANACNSALHDPRLAVEGYLHPVCTFKTVDGVVSSSPDAIRPSRIKVTQPERNLTGCTTCWLPIVRSGQHEESAKQVVGSSHKNASVWLSSGSGNCLAVCSLNFRSSKSGAGPGSGRSRHGWGGVHRRSRQMQRAAIRAGRWAVRVRPSQQSGAQVRFLNIHEYLSHDILRKFSVPTANGFPARTPEEAAEAARKIGGKDFVVKAQVLAGGRGKGRFTNGFEGGVHAANSPGQVRDLAAKMLGQHLVTKQTDSKGRPVDIVYVVERLFIRRECYFAILLDRSANGPVLVASPKGGMDIEKVAAETPDFIFKAAVDDLEAGPTDDQLSTLAAGMGFSEENSLDEAKKVMSSLYQLFRKTDATLVEINPLCETHDGRVRCTDAKLNFDDNAEYRQKEIFELRDRKQEDPREVMASEYGLNYIGLDGNIGCLVNGAGLAMATMDIIKLQGGSPANFLDLGGGATERTVTKAFEILNMDQRVEAILVNIFGGIMKCDVIALGLIAAVTTTDMKKPLVVRLEGTNVDEAKKLIEDSGLRMMTCDDLEDAARKAVRVAEIVRMARDVHIDVKFELPL
ncbi:Succinate-CoA ligase subunit beta [Plasmodiophora brassicae]